jgi:hypothetical protein
MTLTMTTKSGRTQSTQRYRNMREALRRWAVPFARGEEFTIEAQAEFTRTCLYTPAGDLQRII